MHELGRFIQGLMDGRGWRQADLVRASGMNRGTVSRLLTREHLGGMVSDHTIASLHRAFPEVREEVFISKAAEALGIPVGRLTADPDISRLSDEALLGILAERLKGRRSSDGRQPEAEKSPDVQQEPGRQEGGSDGGKSEDQKSDDDGMTWFDSRRKRVIDQGLPVEEAADDHRLNLPPDDEDVSQDPDDWGNDE